MELFHYIEKELLIARGVLKNSVVRKATYKPDASTIAYIKELYSGNNAPWGELMSTIARRNGVAGCVCDSQVRDCVKIIEMDFPVYYSGIRPLDSKGRAIVIAYDVPVRCGEVLVYPGDIIFADFDGVVVIPKACENDVFEKAKEKVNNENFSRKELLNGRSLREVYDKYKSL